MKDRNVYFHAVFIMYVRAMFLSEIDMTK